MATTPSATPTPITPPRVPLIDERTGLIDRAWYLFFLSLFRASETVDSATLGTSAESLMASYDAALRALAQTTETQPSQIDCCVSVDAVRQEVQTQPASGVAELTQEVSNLRQEVQLAPSAGVAELAQEVGDLRQEVQTIPRPQLGTFAALQQASLPWTTFDTTPESVPTDVGTVAWDGGTTLGIQMTANVIQRVGESEFVYVKASAAITKGQLCYHTGSVGSSGVITAAPTPIGLVDPNQIVGVAAESIALNGFGLIQISGDLRGFDTTGSSVGETWADGDPLYYNPAYVGSMTKVKPVAPNQKSYIGEVINAGSGGSGSMHVRIVQGSVLGGTDSNVQFGTLANNDLIQYNTTLGYWTNVTAASVTAGTATNLAGGLAGSVPYQSAPSTTTFLSIGAANRVLTSSGTAPQWSTALTGLTGVSTTTLSASSTVTLSGGTANGVLYLDASKIATSGTAIVFDGSNLGIGTSGPTAKLHIYEPTAAAARIRVLANGGQQAALQLAGNGTTFGTTSFDVFQDGGSDAYVANRANASLQFWTNNSEKMRLTASGSLGIGTSGPTAKLQVYEPTAAAAQIRVLANGGQQAALQLAGNGTTFGTTSFDVFQDGGSDAFVANRANASLQFFTNNTERARITSTGSVVAGGSVALATTAVNGFLYVPTCAGTPTGVPTSITGMAPIVVDTTNNKLYFYSGGAWRDAGP